MSSRRILISNIDTITRRSRALLFFFFLNKSHISLKTNGRVKSTEFDWPTRKRIEIIIFRFHIDALDAEGIEEFLAWDETDAICNCRFMTPFS